jgi:type IV secretory pathway VirB4 component
VQQCETLLEEIEQTSQKIFCMQLVVHVYGKEIEDAVRKAESVLQIFSRLNAAEMHLERWGAVEPIFISTLPGWPKKSSRLVLLKTTHLADLLPFFSDFCGSGRGECIFLGPQGGLITYDPFSDSLPAFNTIVIGSPGSGKSFTINQIINQYSKNDPIEIFIDIGGSYKRQVLLKGGDYIHLGLQEKFTINLFDLPANKKLCDFDEEEQNEILILKTRVIQQMIGGLTRFREADQIVEDYIFRSIVYLYEHFDKPVLSNFKEALKRTGEINQHFFIYYEQMAGLMGNWFKGGKYGKYTDGASTISLDKNVICFDLKGLEQFDRLQAVMLTIVTNFIWGKIMGELGRRKFVIFDECWKLLGTPEAAGFIAECYRTFRKYGAGAISITQSLNDFLVGGLEHAILGNSNTRFILRQNSAKAVKQIVDYFNFNEQEQQHIESLQIKKGEYAEVFFSQSRELKPISAKIVVYPTPIEYWVATTDAKDLNYYEEIRRINPGMSVYEAIEKCATDYPNGVAHDSIYGKGRAQ